MTKTLMFMSELSQEALEELVKEALSHRGYSVNAVTFHVADKCDPRGDVYCQTITAKVSIHMPAKPRQEQWNGDK